MKALVSPFPTSGYFGPDYFCDRKAELKILSQNIESGQSTSLVSLRRLGKTGLIKHCLHARRKSNICIYLDILATEDQSDFLNSLASSILRAVPQNTTIGQKIWQFIIGLRPVISYDSITGDPNVSISIEPKEAKLQIESLLDLLETQNKKVIIAIDEFQQITNYPEKNTDAWLRGKIQHLKNVVFIFSGSQQQLMTELFNSPNRPFFRSSAFMQLKKIDHTSYQNFIHSKFKNANKYIDKEQINEILEWTNGHTYYVQLLCNRVFINAKDNVPKKLWQEEAYKILKEQEYAFFAYRDLLTKPQWDLLKGIAKEGKVFEPTSSRFIKKHNLGGSATVLRSLKSLYKKEMIYKDFTPEGYSFYSVYDLLFSRWVERM